MPRLPEPILSQPILDNLRDAGGSFLMLSMVDGIFWGVFLVALGAWLIVRRFVPVHIPVIRIVVAALFVYLGVRVLAGNPVVTDRNTAVFSQSAMIWSADRSREYNLIFSSGSVDLSRASPGAKSIQAEVNVVFGSGTLRIDPSAPVRVTMSSAFGTVVSPDGRSVAFGDLSYATPSWREGAPALEIHATAVFGRLSIVP